MPKYIFAYHGGKKPESPEEGAKMMENWHAWIGQLGSAIDSPGNPVGMSKTVSSSGVSDDGGANPLSGYSIVEADSMEDVIVLAKSCPMLDIDGTIEVAEIMEM